MTSVCCLQLIGSCTFATIHNNPYSFRDRVRTAINVVGDGFAASIVAHILKERLDEGDARSSFRTHIKEEIRLLQKCLSLKIFRTFKVG